MKAKSQPTAAKKSISIDPTQKGLSVPQCALYAGLSHWQVRMAIWQGRLSAKRVGKSLVILRSDADKFRENLPTVNANVFLILFQLCERFTISPDHYFSLSFIVNNFELDNCCS